MEQRSLETNKDVEALFHQLVNDHGEELMRLAFMYVKNHSVAEDIIQDVYMKAFEQIHNFNHKSTYKTYLYRITINRCHDYFRSWSYKNVVLTEAFSTIFQSGDEPENKVMRDDENYFIGKNILELSIKYREVIILYYYKDFSIEEIAHLLNCSVNTIKTRLRRGRIKLKEKLSSLEGGN